MGSYKKNIHLERYSTQQDKPYCIMIMELCNLIICELCERQNVYHDILTQDMIPLSPVIAVS